MEDFTFKPCMPGIRTLWVLRFRELNNDVEACAFKKWAVDFFIPAPGSQNEWMQVMPEKNQAALHVLENIQTMCQKIKEDCNQPLSTQEGLKKIEEVSGNLKNLDGLMRQFNELLKKLKPPPDVNPPS
jgi:hypothetical protein